MFTKWTHTSTHMQAQGTHCYTCEQICSHTGTWAVMHVHSHTDTCPMLLDISARCPFVKVTEGAPAMPVTIPSSGFNLTEGY